LDRRSRPTNAQQIALYDFGTPQYQGRTLVEQALGAHPGTGDAPANAVAAKLYAAGVTDLNSLKAYGYADAYVDPSLEPHQLFGAPTAPVAPVAPRKPLTAADAISDYGYDLVDAAGKNVAQTIDLGNNYYADLTVGANGRITPNVRYQAPSKGFFGDMLDAFGPIGDIAAAYFGGPWAVAALHAAKGDSIEDIAKATALTAIGGEVASGASESLAPTIGSTAANIAGNVASAAVTGRDPLQALVMGGLSEGTAAVTAQIPGFQDLPAAAQKMVNSAVGTELAGGNASQAAINAALSAGTQAAQRYAQYGAPSDTTVYTEAQQQPSIDALLKELQQYQTGWAPSADSMAADNIDMGGGWNPATGTGDQATADAAAQTGVTSSASTPHYKMPAGVLSPAKNSVKTGTPKVSAKTGAQNSDMSALLAMLGSAGGAATQSELADVELMQDIFGTTLTPKAASSKSIAALLRTLKG